ncbi:2-octaprenyl-6-methoxyphenyl hydroxylase [Thalassotalea euphylliae]|uniref:2-octaprenyl-6-methoxyphenyl hydroxylase n=1 Tax=Thalassotalea euphylliae TaxID=1655234 RepID=A0A3E0TTT4_9GAMM|nr:2-octaprenyl-6-methoxyphenyl hydroxylase [Thalassotalea euphylliae]REL27767.1 2-octaprenyl-6-methoxyphenyl hydroxylase [Thalassotalea euphylliae]
MSSVKSSDVGSVTSQSQSAAQQLDICIVGGGLSGLLMAVSLLKQPAIANRYQIAIIEANKLEPSQVNQFDDRVLALSHGSVEYLRSLGVWSLMADDANPIEHIHISDRGHYGKARIKAEQHHVEALGYVIPLASIANGLLSALQTADEHSNPIQWFTDSQIEQLSIKAEHTDIKLSASAQAEPIDIEAKLVIACDGGQSLCRQAANIGTSQQDYDQWAVIANVCPELPHNNRAFERFTEHGPIAMLPMTNQQCSLVWTLPPEQAEQMSTLDDQAFCLALEQAFGHWLGGIRTASKRTIFPLSLVQAERQSFHRMALVGNASHTIHPIAGQGFNLGLRDVKVLANLLASELSNELASKKHDAGSAPLLNQYQTLRASDQQAIIKLTDSMVTLFSNDIAPLVAGRNVGLKVMNYLSPLQKAFVNKTMGY